MTRSFFASGALFALGIPAFAQTTAPTTSATPLPGAATGGTPAAPSRPQPVAAKPFATVGGFALSGYLRSRLENYNWFETPGFDDNYTFSGHQLRLAAVKSSPKLDIQFDLQQTLLTNLPDRAIAPAPRGILGLGGNYYAANGEQDGALTVKQAFLRFKGAVGKGSAVRLGRFEFNEGVETVAKDPTLNWLKTQRIASRLVATFGFTHTGRSFDGVQMTAPVGKNGANFSGVAARPTEGVFQLEGNNNIDSTGFLYGAYTLPMADADARIFGLIYQDGREAPKSVKTDNRPAPIRAADSEEIRVYTLGANYLKKFETPKATFDVLAWGALQGGDWGRLDHKGNAFDLEAGYQPKGVKLRPWLRAGYYRASGDKNNADGKHETFFTPLSTPRLYARFPFFNQMNLEDTFAQLILRPNAKTNIRLDAHRLNLSEKNDLAYFGGGAFQDGGGTTNGFGFGGRPSNGNKSLANLFDVSVDYTINPMTSVGLYYGYAQGRGVFDAIYGQSNAHLAFVEFSRKF